MQLLNKIDDYVAFDFEWSSRTNKLFCAGFVDDMGNEEVYHLDDFTNEEELLAKICKKILKYPITIGYYTIGENSDLQQLHNRCIANFLPSIVNTRKANNLLVDPIFNRIHLDLFQVFDKGVVRNYIYKKKYKDMKLGSVAMALLGHGKTEGISGKNVESMPIEKQKEYCLNDARLTMELSHVGDLDKKTRQPLMDNGLMNLMYALAERTKLPIQNICHFGMAAIWRKILRDFAVPESDIAFRAKPGDKKRQGPLIMEPVVGSYENVVVLDVASLYPAIIVNHNISSDAMCCTCCSGIESAAVPNKELWSCRKHVGAVTQKIKEMRAERMLHKHSGNKVMADGLKIVMNAKTGLFNNPYYEYGDVRCYDSIIAYERYYIQKIMDQASRYKARVIYSDTDSVFLPDSTAEIAAMIIADVKRDHGLELEHEKSYRKFLITSKKHYIGIKDDGDTVVAGMEGEKNDRPKWINDAFAQFVHDYATDNDPLVLLKGAYQEFKEEAVKLDDLAYSVKLTKNWQDYEKDNVSKQVGQIAKAQAGDVVRYWKTWRGLVVEQPTFAALDKKSYEDTFESTFSEMLRLLGYDISRILSGQLTLTDFWTG